MKFEYISGFQELRDNTLAVYSSINLLFYDRRDIMRLSRRVLEMLLIKCAFVELINWFINEQLWKLIHEFDLTL